jgi:hypothetical protein
VRGRQTEYETGDIKKYRSIALTNPLGCKSALNLLQWDEPIAWLNCNWLLGRSPPLRGCLKGEGHDENGADQGGGVFGSKGEFPLTETKSLEGLWLHDRSPRSVVIAVSLLRQQRYHRELARQCENQDLLRCKLLYWYHCAVLDVAGNT